MSSNMADLYNSLRRKSNPVCIHSVDPDRDTLAVLREYADGFGVDDTAGQFLWMPLRGRGQTFREWFRAGGR